MSKKHSKPSKNKLSIKRGVLIAVGVLALLSGLIFIGYFLYSSIHSWEPDPKAYNDVINNDNFQIAENFGYYSVKPVNSTAQEGLIIYQGAFADARAYLAPYSALADSGIAVFVVRSPFGFALFNIGGANQIIKDNPEITIWYVGGHSLGGVAACEYAKSNPQKIKGLILLGSFCNGNAASLNTEVLSISASKDGLSTTEKIDESRTKLPADTKFVVIDGANHSQFASLEKIQPGDMQATIGQLEATSQINDAIINFVR